MISMLRPQYCASRRKIACSPFSVTDLAGEEKSSFFKRKRAVFLFLSLWPVIASYLIPLLGLGVAASVAVDFAGGTLPYFLYFIININRILKFRSALLAYALAFVALSAGVGLMLGVAHLWITRDIIADVSRYAVPFISMAVYCLVFRGLTMRQVERLLIYDLCINATTMFVSLVKMIQVGLDIGSFVYYTAPTVSVSILSLLILMALYSKLSLFWRGVFLLGSLLTIAAPFMSLSKTGIVQMAVFILALFFLGIARRTILILTLFVSGLSLSVLSMPALERLSQAAVAVQSGDFSADTSTAGRALEIIASVNSMGKSSLSWPFGYGSGALWYPADAPGTAVVGLNGENFRSDGGVHHIHSAWIAILFRHGVVGVILYFILIVFLVVEAYRNYLFFEQRKPVSAGASAACFIGLTSILVVMWFQNSGYGSIWLGFLGALVFTLRDLRRQELLSAMVK